MIQINKKEFRLFLIASWIFPLVLVLTHYINVHYHESLFAIIIGTGYTLLYFILLTRMGRYLKKKPDQSETGNAGSQTA